MAVLSHLQIITFHPKFLNWASLNIIFITAEYSGILLESCNVSYSPFFSLVALKCVYIRLIIFQLIFICSFFSITMNLEIN